MKEGNGHVERLINAMRGEPFNYDYTGECRDLGAPIGRCACGHGIRYEFVLRHRVDRHEVIVGSVCVENAPFISREVVESIGKSLAELKKAERERIKAAKAAEEQAKFEKTLADWRELAKQAAELWARNLAEREKDWSRPRLHHTLVWHAVGYERGELNVKKYKRLAKMVEIYEAETAKLREALKNPYVKSIRDI